MSNQVTASVKYGAPDNPTFENSNPWTVTLRYKGRRMVVHYYTGLALSEPTAAGVLETLLTDAASIENSGSFEDWAADLGFDSDSRSAETIYKATVEQTNKLRRLLGEEFQERVFPPYDYAGDDFAFDAARELSSR
jgi:hypothetical protein